MKEKLVNELLEYFINEGGYLNVIIPEKYEEKRQLLRGIINLRKPISIDQNILELEDKLLKLELEEKGIVDVQKLEEIEKNIIIWQGDITRLKSDAIVNAGNSYGLGCFSPCHGCIDNAIHTCAGIRLRLECNDILNGRLINNGDIIVCDGYNLPSKYVITTVGPNVKNNVTKKDEEDLSKCYKTALEYAVKNEFKSIVFPSISTGVFNYPINMAKLIAYKTVKEFLKYNDIKVIFDLYSEDDYNEYRNLFESKRDN